MLLPRVSQRNFPTQRRGDDWMGSSGRFRKSSFGGIVVPGDRAGIGDYPGDAGEVGDGGQLPHVAGAFGR